MFCSKSRRDRSKVTEGGHCEFTWGGCRAKSLSSPLYKRDAPRSFTLLLTTACPSGLWRTESRAPRDALVPGRDLVDVVKDLGIGRWSWYQVGPTSLQGSLQEGDKSVRSRERRRVETEVAVICFEDRGRGHSQGMQVDGKS